MNKNQILQKGISTLLSLAILFLILLGAGGYYYGFKVAPTNTFTPTPIYSITPTPTVTPLPQPALSKKIVTAKGDLTLTYQNGTAKLTGMLARSTPCVEWQVKTISTLDSPPSQIIFNIASRSSSEICIQVLGEPQTIEAQAPASPQTSYKITLDGVTIFSGTLVAAITPSPSPVVSLGTLTYTELKYRLLDTFTPFFYCDPDYYPVGRGDEQQLAIEKFTSIRQNTEEFNAIIAHLVLQGTSNFTNAQKLQIYREHKKLQALILESNANVTYSFSMRIGEESKGSGELITGIITTAGKISVAKREQTFLTCPICLARDTKISTPDGDIPVQNLKPGMHVWTIDKNGIKQHVPILKISKISAPLGHEVVRLMLDDGRELYVSPGHPTLDGQPIGDLMPGDMIDGGRVKSVDRIQYNESYTYDILPAGDTGISTPLDTGAYWANGILIGSTLK